MATTMERGQLFRGENASVGWLSGLDTVAGIWLFLSAFAITGVGAGFYWSNIVCGLVVAVLAAVRAFSFAGRHQPWMSWVNGAIGVWTVLTPWIFGFNPIRNGLWNNLITGVVIAVLAFSSASATDNLVKSGTTPSA